MDTIMQAVDLDQKAAFVQYQLVQRSDMISHTIADAYDRYVAHTDKVKKAYGADYSHKHAVYPLIDFASTEELISLLGNHDINKNYSFNQAVDVIRDRLAKKQAPDNNPFSYIDHLRSDWYNPDTKNFLKQQVIIGLLLKDDHKAKLQEAITAYGRDQIRSLIQDLLDHTDQSSLRYNYIMQGLGLLGQASEQ